MRFLLTILVSLTCVINNLYTQCDLSISVPNDITLCSSANIILDGNISGSYFDFNWEGSNGFFDNANLYTNNTANRTTTYTLKARTESDFNEIINGDFESGNTGFTTQYAYSDPLVTCGNGNHQYGSLGCEGTYLVLDDPSTTHTNFAACNDHTSGSGNMMIVNGASSLSEIWCQTISVNPNTDYAFRAWATSVEGSSPAILQFSIDGVLIGNDFHLNGTTCDWESFYTLWNSGGSTSIEICVTNQNLAGGGNDFALDDIFFGEVCTDEESFEVTIVELEANTPDEVYIDCDNPLVDIVVSSNTDNLFYDWNTYDGIIIGSSQTDQILTSTIGTYTVTVTDINGCTATAESRVLGSTDLPTGSISGVLELSCSNHSTIIDVFPDQNNVSIEWIGDSGNGSSSAYYSSEGIFGVVLTNGFNCRDTIPFEITLNATAPVVTPLTNPILCSGDSTQARIIVDIPIEDFEWEGSNFSLLDSNIILIGNPGYYTYNFEYEDGCIYRDSIFVNSEIEPLPYSINSVDTLNCKISSQLLKIESDSFTQTQWFNNVDLIGADSVQVTSPGWYFAVINDNNGCQYLDSIFIEQDIELPTFQTSIDSIDCLNGNGMAIVSTSIQNEFYWLDENGNATSQDTFFTSVESELELIVIAQNGCSDTSQVSIPASIDFPEVELNFNDINCSNPQALLSAESNILGSNFEWTLPSGDINFTDTLSTKEAGIYKIKVTSPEGCEYQDSFQVAVDTISPQIELTTSLITCDHPSTNINAAIRGDVLSSIWIGGEFSILNDTTVSVSNGGIYTFEVISSNGCSNLKRIEVLVDTISPSIEPIDDIILDCIQKDIEINSAVNVVSDLAWYLNEIELISNNPSISLSAPGIYTLNSRNPLNGCSSLESFEIEIDTTPIDFEVGFNSINCMDRISQILISSNQEINSIIASTSLSDLGDGVFTTTAGGNYSFVLSGSNGCPSEKEISVSVDTLAPIIITSSDTLPCTDSSIVLIAEININNTIINWQGPNNFNAATLSPSTNLAGKYTINVLNPINFCESNDELTIYENEVSIAYTSDLIQPICANDLGGIIIDNISGGLAPYEGIVSYQNSFTPIIEGQLIENIPPGKYNIFITDDNRCTFLDSFIIEERVPFGVDLGPDIDIIKGGDAQLIAASQIADSLLASIQWSPEGSLSCVDCLDPFVDKVEENISFLITLTDIYGCQAEDDIEIRVSIDIEISAPNIFSPNNDNSNDRFTLYTSEINEIEEVQSLLIYDRWGNLVYSNQSFPIHDESQGWNGTYKGSPAAQGVYIYVGRVLLKNGDTVDLSSDVTLIR